MAVSNSKDSMIQLVNTVGVSVSIAAVRVIKNTSTIPAPVVGSLDSGIDGVDGEHLFHIQLLGEPQVGVASDVGSSVFVVILSSAIVVGSSAAWGVVVAGLFLVVFVGQP